MQRKITNKAAPHTNPIANKRLPSILPPSSCTAKSFPGGSGSALLVGLRLFLRVAQLKLYTTEGVGMTGVRSEFDNHTELASDLSSVWYLTGEVMEVSQVTMKVGEEVPVVYLFVVKCCFSEGSLATGSALRKSAHIRTWINYSNRKQRFQMLHSPACAWKDVPKED